jgi:hypothetical protein
MTVLTHLKNRNCDLSLYPDTYISEIENVITYPLWNLSGQMVGYQQYRPNAPKNDKSLRPSQLRYYTWLSKHDGKNAAITAWGVQLLNQNNRYLFLVEGIFDAVKLHNMGLNALALLACNPKPLKSWLWSLGYNIIPVCEGDKAGRKLAKLSNCGLIKYLPDGLDLGDMPQYEVETIFSKYL